MYTFIFMICIHLYLLFSCVCMFVCISGMTESNRGQTVCGASGSNLGENKLGGLFRSVTSSMPDKLNFISLTDIWVSSWGWGVMAQECQ